MDAVFTCAFCFQENSIFVDPSAGAIQSYVEDCQVCCRPNVLHMTWSDEDEAFHVDSEPEA